MSDLFGQSVVINSGVVAVGAMHGDNGGGADSGAAYVFEVSCPADLDGDGLVNTQDFLGFLNAWANGDPSADWNVDGTIDTRDFVAYLNDWVAGCP